MRKTSILLSIIVLAVLMSVPAMAFEEVGERPSRPLEVEVWLNKHNGAIYEPGQYVRAYFQTPEDGYVVVYNVDTQGFVHVLYPKYNDPAWVEGGRIYEIPDPYDGYDLVVDGPTGIEYVVAVASHFPLNLRAIEEIEAGMDSDIYWPMGHITGDPHLAIYQINERLAWGDNEYDPEGYASDVGWFYVQRWVPYPRYIVYQWYPNRYYDPWWDPYIHVHIFTDFYWDHYWCRPWWWCRGCQPVYSYWYIERDSGRRYTWKGNYHRDRRKPDWYREKPVRRDGDGIRPARSSEEDQPVNWDERRRPLRNELDPGTRETGRKAGRENVTDGQTRTGREVKHDDRSRLQNEQRARSSSRADREQVTKSRTRSEMRSNAEAKRSRSNEIKRSRSSGKSETKKLEKSSSRGSSLG
ncbi:DUF4384 domain-containing protein, partial [Candidatus Zixiibacteriota bacterium]